MINNKDINIRLIIHVAKCLGDLRKKVVFVGGCATGLFITDPAIKNAESVELEKGLTIQLVSPPYFLATKVEAFKGRGGRDYMASHDMEDIITVLDGRPEIISEIRSSSEELKTFLADTFHGFQSCPEAMSAGCLVIGSATPPVQEVFDDSMRKNLA